MTPTTAIVHVTPAQSAEWLTKHNVHNRTIRKAKVDAYARDMLNGAWKVNGDTIRFAADGTLLDGQHRLAAIVESGTTISCIVVWGLEPSAQETMDIGAHRLLRDQLHLRGEANSGELAAIARRALLVTRGNLSSGGGGGVAPTHAEMYAYIGAHPEVRRAAEVAAHANGRLPASPSALGAAFLSCYQIDKSDAEIFYVTQVIDGIGLYEGDAAYALRQRVQRELQASGRQMSPEDVYRYSVLAWNHYRSGTKITKLQAPRGGWAPGAIPRPR